MMICMPRFIITYLGGNPPASATEEQRHFARYMEWLDSLGKAAVSPANPLKDTHVIGPDGSVTEGGATTMSGYTTIEADSMKDALGMAKSCPFLDVDGTLEVSQLIEMPS